MKSNRAQGNVTYDNRGRIILVSGGASGIGRAICDAFVESGASVVCFDRLAVDQVGPHSCSLFVTGDTSIEADCERAVKETVAAFGGIDVLVNNAAIQPKESYAPVHEITEDIWQRMIGVNFTGYTMMAKHSIPVMLAQGSGVVVNISSGQGHRTARRVAAYGPIKAANLMQTRQWGVEYARDGIRVVSVSPGAINTPLVQASLEEQGGAAELAQRHPLGRIGEPSEVAAAVLWLSSPHASFITATDLEVDGGLGAFGAFAEPYDRANDK